MVVLECSHKSNMCQHWSKISSPLREKAILLTKKKWYFESLERWWALEWQTTYTSLKGVLWKEGKRLMLLMKTRHIDYGTPPNKVLGHMSEEGLKVLSEKNMIPNVRRGGYMWAMHLWEASSGKLPWEWFYLPLDLVCADVWGPAPLMSRGGARYFLVLMDDYSRKVWVYLLRHKDEVFGKFKPY